jgi:hypothetical protein
MDGHCAEAEQRNNMQASHLRVRPNDRGSRGRRSRHEQRRATCASVNRSATTRTFPLLGLGRANARLHLKSEVALSVPAAHEPDRTPLTPVEIGPGGQVCVQDNLLDAVRAAVDEQIDADVKVVEEVVLAARSCVVGRR